MAEYRTKRMKPCLKSVCGSSRPLIPAQMVLRAKTDYWRNGEHGSRSYGKSLILTFPGVISSRQLTQPPMNHICKCFVVPLNVPLNVLTRDEHDQGTNMTTIRSVLLWPDLVLPLNVSYLFPDLNCVQPFLVHS